jgi:hypothetical protein
MFYFIPYGGICKTDRLSAADKLRLAAAGAQCAIADLT